MPLRFSEQESLILGYRIARGDDSSLNNLETLKKEIKEQKIDVLKLSLSMTDKNLYCLLDELAYPYYILGISIEYKYYFHQNQEQTYQNSNIDFVEYKGQDEVSFKHLVKEVFEKTPASFYTNPALVKHMNQESQLDCLAEYISTLHSAQKKDHYTHLLKIDDTIVGFVCSYKEGRGGGASYSGVLPKYQSQGLYLDMIRFIQNYGRSLGQEWGTSTVQLQNTSVQRSFQKMGMQACGYVLNVHINSFEGKLKA